MKNKAYLDISRKSTGRKEKEDTLSDNTVNWVIKMRFDKIIPSMRKNDTDKS